MAEIQKTVIQATAPKLEAPPRPVGRKPECRRCQSFKPSPFVQASGVLGECHRHAPRPEMQMADTGEYMEPHGRIVAWPLVQADSYCEDGFRPVYDPDPLQKDEMRSLLQSIWDQGPSAKLSTDLEDRLRRIVCPG